MPRDKKFLLYLFSFILQYLHSSPPYCEVSVGSTESMPTICTWFCIQGRSQDQQTFPEGRKSRHRNLKKTPLMRNSTANYSMTTAGVKSLHPNMCLFFFFLFFWVGELFITHTWTCNERNHKCQTEGHPQPKLQATLTTWVEAETKVCKEATCQAKQAAHKAVVDQPTAKPVHCLQTKHHLCLNQPNIAVKITSIMKC